MDKFNVVGEVAFVMHTRLNGHFVAAGPRHQ
jgi:hypothetical protein